MYASEYTDAMLYVSILVIVLITNITSILVEKVIVHVMRLGLLVIDQQDITTSICSID